LRYRQLAVGILMSVATSYGNPVVAPLQAQPINAFKQSREIRLNNIRPTTNGLMLSVNGNPQIRIQREDNPDRLIVDLQNTSVVKELHQTNLPLNRFGVKQVRVAQYNPEIARLVFDLDSNDPNRKLEWKSQYNGATKSLLLTPVNQVAQAIPIEPNPIDNPNVPVLIERLSFSNTGLLVIEGNQPIGYQTNLDRLSRTYKVIVPNAKISPTLQRPSLAANSPIERIRLTQVGSSVEIGVKTIAGWQMRESQRTNNQQIKLQVSLISVSQVPNNSTSLPSNSPNESNPQTVGDRRRGLIYIDAGHGGNDPGAVGNGIQEKDVVLPISLDLGRALQSMGYSVYYTRTDDVEIDLEPRVASAESVNADVFVSIHANSLASRNSGISGVETYHARGSTVGRELADYVHTQIIENTGAIDRSVRAAGFYVIARSSMPAILVETGFVTNADEAANLNNPSYQKRMAEAIAKGIDQFMRVRGK